MCPQMATCMSIYVKKQAIFAGDWPVWTQNQFNLTDEMLKGGWTPM